MESEKEQRQIVFEGEDDVESEKSGNSKGKKEKANGYMAKYEALQNSAANKRRTSDMEMGAVKAYGSDINPNRRQAIPTAFNGQSTSKWQQDQNIRGSNPNHNYPGAHLITMSPEGTLTKNTKAGAQLAPLNHNGPMPSVHKTGMHPMMPNIPSIEQLQTYNKLQPLNHVTK